MDDVYDRYPDRAASLRAQLEGFGAILENPPHPSMDAELMDRLRALGYVGDETKKLHSSTLDE
jgi:hypothetical protein